MKNILLLCMVLILFVRVKAQTECINLCNNIDVYRSVPTWDAYISHHEFYSLDFESGRHYRITFNEPALLNGLSVSVNGTAIESGDEFEWTGGDLGIFYSFDENTALFQTATMDFVVEKRTLFVYHVVSAFQFRVHTTCFPYLVISAPVTLPVVETHRKYEVNDNIVASDVFTPNTCGCGGEIWMDAGTYIELLPGFKTNLVGGGTVEAFIDGCGGSRSMELEEPIISTTETGRNSLTIYPNPTTGNLNVLIEDFKNEMLDLRVTDISGRILTEQKVQSSSSFNIDLSGYSKGIYLIMITDGYQIKTSKVILE